MECSSVVIVFPSSLHPCPILSTSQILSQKIEVLFDRFLLFASHQRHLEIFYDIPGPGWKLVYLIDSLYLANRGNFWTIRRVEFSTLQFISLVRVTPCKFVNSADSFYSANGKCYLRHDKKSFDLLDSTNGKYYARSDILCSPSEDCILFMTITLASLSIRPIRSIRRRDNFIHDLPSRVSIRQYCIFLQ